MSSAPLWIKAFHIVFVASWFAGLFCLWLGCGVGGDSGWVHAKLAPALVVVKPF